MKASRHLSVLADVVGLHGVSNCSLGESFLSSVGLYAEDFDLVRLAPDALNATSIFQVDSQNLTLGNLERSEKTVP